MQPALAIGAVAAAVTTSAWHRRWESAYEGTPRRGLFDGLCHLGTALAVSLPILPYVRDRAGFLRISLLSSVMLDLDHVLAARSIRLTDCMTMPQRPASHSVLTPFVIAALAERWKPEQHFGLAALVGLSSHLLRDLGTGGAPLLHPRHIVTVPYKTVVVLLGTLSFVSRYSTRTAIGGKILARRAWHWAAAPRI
ncbi:MAG TPA: hypothetical protein VHV31_14245 [Nitrolancea sp.]|jgi:hypothetical protein|nr:hypothetical protein [Nitrolancea sp.]